jgi:biopolymer transport protein ExbD
MIAARQPVIQALLVLTLSVLVGYSLTTARAAEKEVPPKVHEGKATQKPSAESPRSTKSKESSQKPRKGDGDRSTTSSSELITLQVIDGGDTVLIGDEKVPMNRLRGFLSTFLPDHPGAKVEVTGNDDTPLKALHNTVDAVRDNGNKTVGIKAE